jgi:ABC-type transport system substrate-binding protein
LRTGQQDIITGSREMVAQAKSAGATVATRADANIIGFYVFQADRPGNVFDKVEVRQAAAYAIDHKLLAETIWGGVGIEPWGCTWPPPTEISAQNPRYIKACGKPYPYDPQKAKELLAKAGYPPGKGPDIKLEYSMSYPEEGAMAEAMEPMLTAVGFHVKIERTDIAERNRRRHSGGHINSLLFFGPGGRITALAGVNSVYGPNQDWGPQHDKDLIAAIGRASHATSLDEYTNAIADIGEIVHDRAYGPGFFSAGSLIFLRRGIPDWGLIKSVGRAPMNLAAFVTQR